MKKKNSTNIECYRTRVKKFFPSFFVTYKKNFFSSSFSFTESHKQKYFNEQVDVEKFTKKVEKNKKLMDFYTKKKLWIKLKKE